MIQDNKPIFIQIQQLVTGTLVGTATYNSSLAYNSSEPYGGFSGGQGNKPTNVMVFDYKPKI